MGKITQELKTLKEKAELSDHLKSAFLANMSHEMRTPLNAIVVFSELLASCDNPDDKEEYVNTILSNNELLLRLINDILDLYKIESGILECKREKFSLTKVCSELYTMIQPKIINPAVEFQMSAGPEYCVFLDRNRLKQVWMNFLTNAIKYTKSDIFGWDMLWKEEVSESMWKIQESEYRLNCRTKYSAVSKS